MRNIFRRKGLGIFAPVAVLALLSSATTANAASYTVSNESEWEFTVSATETVYIYGNSNRDCNQPGADPYLWLYNSSGTLVAQNDDGNHGAGQCVSSKIVQSLQPDTYTIRAGYCCSQRTLGTNPSGYDYELIIQNYELTTGATTTTTTTTTTVPTTTTTSTTTTTIPQTVGAPTNLSLTVDYSNGTVTADWDAPTDGTLSPERYAIGFGLNDEGNAGPYGIATGNVGDENALNTEYTFNASYLEGLFNEAHGLFNVMIRSDNDTNAVYSSWTPVSSVTIRNMPDSVDSTTISQVFGSGLSISWTPSTDGFVDPAYYKIQYDQNGEVVNQTGNINSTSYAIPYSNVSDGTWWFTVLSCGLENDCNAGTTIEVNVFDEEASWATSTTTTAPPTTTTTVLPSTTSTTTTTSPSQPLAPPAGSTTSSPVPVVTTPPVTTTTSTTTTTTTTIPPTTTSTTTTTTTTLPPTTTTTSTSTTVPTTTTTAAPTTTVPRTTTTSTPPGTTTSVVGTTTSIPRPTTTVSAATTTTIKNQITSQEIEVIKVPIPENETRAPEVKNSTPESKAKASEAIQFIADDELAGEVFTVVAAEEVTVEDVQELVSNENFDELPPEAKEAISVALSDEPNEIKETFEEEVNVFEGGFDEYVPADSKIPVKTRRVLVVATTAAFILPSPRGKQ